MQSPVLLLAFNRPDTTLRVFEAIRAQRPPRLYVAVDGPRPGREGEALRCALVREVATAVDWPCEVKTLFRDHNVGCARGPYHGISWFFENEECGIILEDDVLPNSTFFGYCDELLVRYRNDHRIAMVSGNNFVANRVHTADSYMFSRHTHIWGWASWRRAWQYYDLAMKEWPAWRDDGGLGRMAGGNPRFESYWRRKFDSVHSGEMTTCWDYQWTFACWRRDALTILPKFNQTRNLGFGADATHTTAGVPAFVTASNPIPLVFPLAHPIAIEQNLRADAAIDAEVFGINFWSTLKSGLRKIAFLDRLARVMKARN